MVPEDQRLPVGGVVLGAVLDEARQRGGLHQRLLAVVRDQLRQRAVFDLVDLVHAVGDAVDLPLLAAAGVDDDVHVGAERGLGHLLQVVGRHAGLRLQVGAAHVDHDREFVLAAAEDLRALGAGAGGHGAVQLARVGRAGPAGGDGAAAGEAAQQAGEVQPGGGRRGAAAQEAADAAEQQITDAAGGTAGGAAAQQTAEDAAAAHKDYENNDNEQLAAAETAARGLALPALVGLLRVAGTAGAAAAGSGGIALFSADGAGVQTLAPLGDGLAGAGDVFAPAGWIDCHRNDLQYG